MWAARVVFLLGLLNIASALVRRSPRLLDWSQDYLPPFGAAASVAVVGIGVGCGLLVMARGLRRRKQRAWLATVALLCTAIAVHLLRGTELIQATVSAAVVAILLLGRRQFVGRPEPRSRAAIPLSLFVVAVAGWLLGAIAIIADHHATGSTLDQSAGTTAKLLRIGRDPGTLTLRHCRLRSRVQIPATRPGDLGRTRGPGCVAAQLGPVGRCP